MIAGRFSGSVLIGQKGNLLLRKGYGKANFELNVPNTPQTKFRISSISIQFKAMAIFQLQEGGKLQVNYLISKYVDDILVALNDITIHHLLTHTSGIPIYYFFLEYRTYMTREISTLELIDVVRNKQLHFFPGVRYKHSCSCYNILGYIIEKTSGMTYEEFLPGKFFSASAYE